MGVVFACEEAALFDQCVIEAHEGITQLEETLSYLRTHWEQGGKREGEESQKTEQKFEQASLWCRQADEMIGKVGALFEEEMARLRTHQEAMLAVWRAERQAVPVSSGEPVPA